MKKKRKRIAFAVLILFVCLAGIVAMGIQRKSKYDSATKAMVYITNEEQGGNGSIYRMEDNRLIIVTTYHLLQDSDSVMVYFQDQTIAEGNVLAVNEKHDVGFVEINITGIEKETLEQIDCVRFDEKVYSQLDAGDYMEYRYLEWNGGHVSATSQKGSIGHMNWYIEEFDDYFIYNYCDVIPGMSGCAAIAEDGTYLGMMVGGASNESGALSVQVIEKVFDEIE